jgi:hypothetical protein
MRGESPKEIPVEHQEWRRLERHAAEFDDSAAQTGVLRDRLSSLRKQFADCLLMSRVLAWLESQETSSQTPNGVQ